MTHVRFLFKTLAVPIVMGNVDSCGCVDNWHCGDTCFTDDLAHAALVDQGERTKSTSESPWLLGESCLVPLSAGLRELPHDSDVNYDRLVQLLECWRILEAETLLLKMLKEHPDDAEVLLESLIVKSLIQRVREYDVVGQLMEEMMQHCDAIQTCYQDSDCRLWLKSDGSQLVCLGAVNFDDCLCMSVSWLSTRSTWCTTGTAYFRAVQSCWVPGTCFDT